MRKTLHTRFSFILFILTIMIVSCKKDGNILPNEETPIPEAEPLNYELGPNSKIVDPTLWSSIIAVDESSITFQGSSNFARQLLVGDILISAPFPLAPRGFLRKISQISQENDVYKVSTVEPLLTEAFKTLHVDIHQTLNLSDTSNGGGNKIEEFQLALSTVIYDADGNNSTILDQISLVGALGIDVSVDFQLDINFFSNSYFLAGASVTTNLDESLKIGAGVGSFNKDINLFTYNLPPLGDGIFWVTPSLQINLGGDGAIYAQVDFSGTETFESYLSVEYLNSDWVGTATKTFTTSTQNPSFNLNGFAEIYVEGAINLSPYDLKNTNANLSIQPYLKAQGQVISDPGCSLDAGLRGKAEAKLGIGSLTFLSGSLSLFDVSLNLYTCSSGGGSGGGGGGNGGGGNGGGGGGGNGGGGGEDTGGAVDGSDGGGSSIYYCCSINFGNVTVNTTSPPQYISITNTGISDLHVSSISLPYGFLGAWSGTVPPGQTQSVAVYFKPENGQFYEGDLIVNSDATSGAGLSHLTGSGIF